MMRMPTLLIAALLFAQTSIPRTDEQAQPYTDADAYDVYSAIIPSEWPMRVANARMLVFVNTTKSYKTCLLTESESETFLRSAISDYLKKSEKTWILQPKLNLEVPYQMIPPEELNSIFKSGGWKTFNSDYPDSGGWMELSAVGFNADKTAAVVYVGHHCGMRCGGGDFHVLEKKGGKWLPLKGKAAKCSWVS